MIESPLVQELVAESTQETLIEAVMTVLITRFGSKAEPLENQLKAIGDEARLRELLKQAVACRTVSSFHKQLAP